MKLKNLILATCLLATTFVNSQEYPGYFGKKTYFEILSTNGLPLFSNLWGYNGGFNNENGVLRAQNEKWGRAWEWYQFGINVAAGRAINNNFAIGFEYSRHNWKIEGPQNIDVELNGQLIEYPLGGNIYHERIKTIRQTFMPRIELTSGDGLLPMGLTHMVGAGFTLTTMVEDDYMLGYDANSSGYYYSGQYLTPLPDSIYKGSDLIDYSVKHKGIQLMYGIKMRSPLGKSLFLTYGMRYMINIRLSRPSNTAYNNTGEIIRMQISRNNFMNLMSFDIGLSVPF